MTSIMLKVEKESSEMGWVSLAIFVFVMEDSFTSSGFHNEMLEHKDSKERPAATLTSHNLLNNSG